MGFLLFFSKITFFWKSFSNCCDNCDYLGSIVYLSCSNWFSVYERHFWEHLLFSLFFSLAADWARTSLSTAVIEIWYTSWKLVSKTFWAPFALILVDVVTFFRVWQRFCTESQIKIAWFWISWAHSEVYGKEK